MLELSEITFNYKCPVSVETPVMAPRFILPSTHFLALVLIHTSLATALLAQGIDRAWQAAVQSAGRHDFDEAVARVTEAIQQDANQHMLFYHRGRWNFRSGNMKESLADFDRMVELSPKSSSRLWERGLTCYYAGDFKSGAKQFEAYQTYHSNDVENAVWRYLCQIKFDGRDKARNSILPIQMDRRVPMMTIYELFKGEAEPSAVLTAIKQSQSTGSRLRHERFHAHLYLGLFYDSEGDKQRATKHIDLAVKQYERGDYMWAVARQHQQQLKQAKQRSRP